MVNRRLTALLMIAGMLLLLTCGRPTNPTGGDLVQIVLVGQWDSPGYATEIRATDTHVFLADDQSGLHIVDITQITSPTLDTSLGVESFAELTILDLAPDVGVLGVVDENQKTYLYNIRDLDSLQTYQVQPPYSNTRTNELLLVGRPSDSGTDTLMQFTGDSNDGLPLSVYRYTSFNTLFYWERFAGQETPAAGRVLGLGRHGDLIFAAQDQIGLQVFDYSDYTAPAARGWIDTPGSARNIATADSIAYIADGRFGLQIISFQNPDSLRYLSSIEFPGYANDVAVGGNYAYIAAGEAGTIVIDVSNPVSPKVAGGFTSNYTNALAYTGGYVFVADRDQGILILQIQPN